MSNLRRSVVASRRAWLASRRVARDLQFPQLRDYVEAAGDRASAVPSQQRRRRAVPDRQARTTPMTPLALVGATPVPDWMAERVAFHTHLRNCVPVDSRDEAPRFEGSHKTRDVLNAGNAIASVCEGLCVSLEDLHEASRARMKPERVKQEQPRRWGAHQATAPGSAGSYAMPRTA